MCGQAYSYHVKHPQQPWLLVDMHAGDGMGVPNPQFDLFQTNHSMSTPAMAIKLAQNIGNGTVILCEKQQDLRAKLSTAYPTAHMCGNNTHVLPMILPHHTWALIINDPNGYAGHSIATMQQIAGTIASDFVIVFNEGALERLCGMNDSIDWSHMLHGTFISNIRNAKKQYAWMLEPQNWGKKLTRRYVARSIRKNASSGFRYRILVVSNFLSQVIRSPQWEIFTC